MDPLTNDDVADILALLDSLPYDEFDLETPRFRLTLRRAPGAWSQSTQVRSAPEPLAAPDGAAPGVGGPLPPSLGGKRRLTPERGARGRGRGGRRGVRGERRGRGAAGHAAGEQGGRVVRRRLLRAKRGVGAIRVIRTRRRRGVETVLAVSPADADSVSPRVADK